MASAKLPPRQKMINMMYLVLTAMLAMNISKEVLDQFVLLDADLGRSELAHHVRTSSEYAVFEASALNVPAKFKLPLERAHRAGAAADSLVAYIEEMKVLAIAEAEGLERGEVLLKSRDGRDSIMALEKVEAKDDRDALAHLFVGSEPGDPKDGAYTAKELKQRVSAYRDELKTMVPPKDDRLLASLDVLFDLGDRRDASGTLNNWESLCFYEVPLVAGIATLSKLQADIRSAENDVVRALYRSVNGDSHAFTDLMSAVIPQSNYITVGDSFRADVFLAAYDAGNLPVIELALEGAHIDTNTMEVVGPKASVPVGRDGLGKLRLPGSVAGMQEREGIIRFKGVNGEEKKRFRTSFQVARPELVVSPTKMNVLYRHVENPIEISVPGFAADKVSPRIDNGILIRTREGWVAKPGSGGKALVSVTVELADGSKKSMPPVEFRVKDLPPPVVVCFKRKSTDTKVKKSELGPEQGLRAVLEGTAFDEPWTVTRYKVVLVRAGSITELVNRGNAFSPEVEQLLEKAKPGDQIYIEEIKARLTKAPDSPERNLAAIALRVIPG
ncbi:MAG: gliding motility protein GldM [Flavobacteriales bacterium]|nr:MAG: gliding motility protein GldM [Flavobacteriales bacterium]